MQYTYIIYTYIIYICVIINTITIICNPPTPADGSGSASEKRLQATSVDKQQVSTRTQQEARSKNEGHVEAIAEEASEPCCFGVAEEPFLGWAAGRQLDSYMGASQ